MSDPDTVHEDLAGALRQAGAPDAVHDGALRARLESKMFGAAGQQLGRYEVIGLIGRGGLGEVYACSDPALQRRVAVKLLRVSRRKDEHVQRLVREAKTLARLNHPNIVPVYDIGRHEGQVFVAMELVEGGTLRTFIDEPHRWRRTLDLLVQAGRGLQAAHRAGVVHRDFKPDNVLLARDGRVLVSDFGLARLHTDASSDGAETDDAPNTAAPTLGGDSTALRTPITGAGVVMGTAAYMAPEQHFGANTDPRADQFSFCVTLYEALYAQRPFVADTMVGLLRAKRSGKIAPPAASSVPAAVHRAVVRGLAPDPDHRFASMQGLLDALVAGTRTRGRWALVLVGASALATFIAWPRAGPCENAASLGGVWDAERRTAARSGVLATELAYAGSTWERVEAGLDGFADDWRAAARRACREADGEPTAQRQCLGEQRAAMRAAVDALEDPRHDAVAVAAAAVEQLPDPADCDAADARPAPADVAALRVQLAYLRAQLHSGVINDAGTARGLATARELGHGRSIATAQFVHGKVLSTLERYDEGRVELSAAFFVAGQEGDTELAAEAAIELASLLTKRRQHLDEAQQWLRHARAALTSIDRPHQWGPLLREEALLARAQGDLDQAARLFEQSIAAFEAAHGPGFAGVSAGKNWIAEIHLQRREFEAALPLFREALEICERALGPNHPNASAYRLGMAAALVNLDRSEEALEQLDEALRIALAALPADHPYISSIRINRGAALANLGRPAQAAAEYLAARERYRNDDPTSFAIASSGYGNALLHQERPAEAVPVLREAVDTLDNMGQSDSPEVASALSLLGDALEQVGRPAEAADAYRRAIAIREPFGDNDLLAYRRFNLGLALAQAQRWAEARDVLRDAITRGAPYDIDDDLLAQARAALKLALSRLDGR